MAGTSSDRLLGVRDGFVRYFRDGLDRPVSVAVVPQPGEVPLSGLPGSDEEAIELARRQALDLSERLGGAYQFYVGSEGGVRSLALDGRLRYFIGNWTVLVSPFGEAWGASGSIELPDRLVAGLDGDQVPFVVPGTRRSGGIISSLTGGLETRRTAVGLSTLHALSSLFFGVLEGRPPARLR